jgi:iron complex outermembrane receptor protein
MTGLASDAPRNRAPSVAVFAAMIVGWSPSAAAQEAAPPITLPEISVTGERPGSLVVPPADAARREIERTPGAVEVVPDTVWRDTPASTLKDVLGYTPGVFVQPKWGEDSRLSIRGSGLSRNFHLRGIQLLQDGVPVTNADGGSDFQEIDPTAFRYAEVYKGANALRYGGATLGGAINFVSPTGYDADLVQGRADGGSFGFRRVQASSGAANGIADGFVTGSWAAQGGFRDHSEGDSRRASGNAGWRFSKDAETRLYFNVTDIDQEIPGSVTRSVALDSPKTPAANNVTFDYQRNMKTARLASKTTLRFDGTSVEFGGSAGHKHLIHPIFQYLDYEYYDFGGFGRVTDDRQIAGHDNRLVVGLTVTGGWIDNSQSVNLPGGEKGTLLSQSKDSATTTVVYAENSFDIRPDVSLIAGGQFVRAVREREDELAAAPDTSGKRSYDFFNPKGGVIWRPDPGWQVFANLSRSGEAPTFSELNFTNTALSDTEAQRATTFEIGTRGGKGDVSWDVALYRAHLKNEFQFFDLGGGNFQVTNADDTVHQGIEAGFGWSFWKEIFAKGAVADSLQLNGAYTFSDFRFDDDPVWGDNELPGAPRHYLRAELLYRHPVGLYAGPNVEWVPQAYYIDNANTVETRPYALLGFRVGFEVNKNVSLFVDGRNLTDERYIASTSVVAVASPTSAVFEPGTGRAVFGGLRVAW